MNKIDFLVAGVGGQGTILASDILAEVGMEAGYDAKKSDVLGLAVRGGSVLSHVRWGRTVASPVSRKGTIDYLLGFEPLEALRGTEFLHPQSTALVNTQPIPPVSVSSGDAIYPAKERLEQILHAVTANVYFVEATKEAIGLGSSKVTNVVMIGAFSALLDVPVEVWEKVILSRVPEKYSQLNKAAFFAGRELIQGARIS
ncbi:MAG TPA: indolepyruvate ferredoxin oxidoreductase [Candidatus Acetothermia bacterium]|nr:indolepyruvate ferredoxin oxidoreductase [Candidatus Acetothermia bacterium]